MTAIDKQSAAYRAGLADGADQERDRIAAICSSEAAQQMPTEALVMALGTDLDDLSARLQLTQRARLPEEERGPLTSPIGGYDPALTRDASGKTIRNPVSNGDGTPQHSADADHGWGGIVADLNREAAKTPSKTDAAASAAPAADDWSDVVARLNASRGR